MDLTGKRRHLEALTSIGIHVVPLWWVKDDGTCSCGTNCGERNRGKHPLPGIGWFEKATTDMRRVDNWLAAYPNCNWGVLTGTRSGVFIVDIDAASGGHETWAELTKDKPPLPPTLEVLTGGGGRHLYFVQPVKEPVATRVSVLDGIDIRGEGNSQAVAPPSTHKSGKEYTWVVSPLDKRRPTEAPPWLLDLLYKQQRKAAKARDDMSKVAKLGTRDDAIFHHAVALLGQGLDADLAVHAVWAWVEAGGVEQTPQDRIDRTYVEDKVKAAVSYITRKKGPEGDVTFSHHGNADRLLPDMQEKVRHEYGVGWMVWDGKVWMAEGNKEPKRTHFLARTLLEQKLRDEITSTTRDRIRQLGMWLNTSLNTPHLNNTLGALATQPSITVDRDQVDAMPLVLNFQNGTVDLATGELRAHRKSDMLTKIMDFDYNPAAECPTFLDTLGRVCGGDKDLEAYMHRALGYSISGEASEQCFFVMFGDGKHGRSTLFNGLQKVLGPYASSMDPETLLQTRSDQVSYAQLALARGTHLVVTSEIAGTLNEERIKRITGGDEITGRLLYENPVTYRPRFVIWVLANNKPVIRSQTEATWRRIRLIESPTAIPEGERRDYVEMIEAIKVEEVGVMAWLVRGFLAWQENGRKLKEPESVSRATNEYRSEMDLVKSFVEEEYETSDGGWVTTKAMYETFGNWCKRNGAWQAPASSVFVKRLRRIPYLAVARSLSGGTFKVTGIKRRERLFDVEDMA